MKIKITKGFSLVEVLIVIGIILIVASITSFSYNRYVNNTNLRNAARQLASDISNMKQQAISKMNSTYAIVFDKSLNNYTMTTDFVTIKSLDSFGSGIKFNTLPLGGSTYTLTFLARGTLTLSSTSATQDTIIMKNNRGSAANIVYNTTGKTYVTFNMQ